MATLPPWLQITPDLQLRALQAGTAAGSDIGRANQQRALAEIQMQQRAEEQAQQAAEFQQRILADQVRNRMDQAFRQQELGQRREISDAELALKGETSAAANAIRAAQIKSMDTRARLASLPPQVQELLDPGTGKRRGIMAGRVVIPDLPVNVSGVPVPAQDTGEIIGYQAGNRFVPRHRLTEGEAVAQVLAQGAAGRQPVNAPIPVPASKSELRVGALYQTARGPATWNGSKFVQ